MTTPIVIEPVAFVRGSRAEATDDFWGDNICTIELAPRMDPSALDGLVEFSHAEILYYFDRVSPASVVATARHPRGNTDWPKVGIFAQRAKARPNRLGSTIVRIVGRDGATLRVEGLDAVDGTPVIDIKPVMREFLPRGEVRQPAWSHELMRDYWRPGTDRR